MSVPDKESPFQPFINTTTSMFEHDDAQVPQSFVPEKNNLAFLAMKMMKHAKQIANYPESSLPPTDLTRSYADEVIRQANVDAQSLFELAWEACVNNIDIERVYPQIADRILSTPLSELFHAAEEVIQKHSQNYEKALAEWNERA